jgi:cytochrome c oxidase cbb3-type subunit 2
MKLTQDAIERNVGLMVLLTLLVVSVGGLVEIVPLFFQKSTTEPVTGLKPYDPVRLTGRDVYIREGCFLCHSQMIRPFRAETERYGHYSVAGEFVYDHPFQWGSKRTGPDLHRVGGRYSDEWHRAHLINPRDVVPESNMPAFAFLEKAAGRCEQHREQDARSAQGRCSLYRRRNRRGQKAARRQERT